MGIRYDRNMRRATNGPLIFFSNYKDETFMEEIRSAFLSGLSFYAYRKAASSMLSYGSSEGFIEGLGTPGFVIGFFSPEKPIITIPYDGIKMIEDFGSLYEMPDSSTDFDSYSHEVSEIIKAIKEGRGDKVVAARVIVKDNPIDIGEQFYDLCHSFPECFVFCFSTPATGCWIGASPELLLQGDQKRLSTMALAGTRKAGSEDSWDAKNIVEQKIVEDYIVEKFLESGLMPKAGEPYNKITGGIEHLCTKIESEFPKEDISLERFVRKLSPTPALCGNPKFFALHEISVLENFDRGCYGGFCGPFHFNRDFNFNVVLRCASISEQRMCIYTGGGITEKSEVEAEWAETEMKAINTFPSIV